MAGPEAKPPYRREAFVHGLNLAFLAIVAIAGFYDHNLWLLAAPIEAAMLWIVPDLPVFRVGVDKKYAASALVAERSFYLEQLWGLAPSAQPTGLARVQSWFVEMPPEDPDRRVLATDSREYRAYQEMRSILERLRGLVGMRGVHITEVELSRCEQVINGYLRLLIACRPLERAVAGGDLERLDAEMAGVDERLDGAEGPVRAALFERRELLQQQRERLPRLEATLELFRARADGIVQQLRNIHGQVLADPGMQVNELLDDVMVRHEQIADPLQLGSSEHVVDEFLRRPEVKAKLQAVPAAPLPRPPRKSERN